jgi:transcriptional regulator with XRE-family HTH domain
MVNDDRIYEIIRKNIKTLREKHPQTEEKITQLKLADAIGIERSTLTNIELGNQRPPVHVLYRLCDFFGVALHELMPGLTDVQSTQQTTRIGVGPDQYELPSKTHAALDRLRAKHVANR